MVVFSFKLPLTCNRGDKKLHIDLLSYRINQADANNYINYIKIYGRKSDGTNTEEFADHTNRTAAANITKAVVLTSGDMGAYEYVDVWVQGATNTAGNLDFSSIVLRCHFDD